VETVKKLEIRILAGTVNTAHSIFTMYKPEAYSYAQKFATQIFLWLDFRFRPGFSVGKICYANKSMVGDLGPW
jgi:uncharacterized membrane-anchored protein